MGVHRTCGEPNEIKKNTHPEHTTALYRAQDVDLPSIKAVMPSVKMAARVDAPTYIAPAPEAEIEDAKDDGDISRYQQMVNDAQKKARRRRAVIFVGWVSLLVSLGDQVPHVPRAHMWALNTR